MAFRALVTSDYRRVREGARSGWLRIALTCLSEPGLLACVLIRLQQCLGGSGHRRLAGLMRTPILMATGADVSAGVSIGPGLWLPHPVGVVIGNGVVIGSDVTIAQGVTLGAAAWRSAAPEFPVVGDGAALLARSSVLGGVRVGTGARVNAHVLVTQDVPDHGVARA